MAEGQNYDFQDCASIAASRGKNDHNNFLSILVILLTENNGRYITCLLGGNKTPDETEVRMLQNDGKLLSAAAPVASYRICVTVPD